MCQFLYFFFLAGTQKSLYTFELSFIMKEFIFSFTVTFLISNLTFLFFETPITNLLLKVFNLNRRRDITVNKQEEDVKVTKQKEMKMDKQKEFKNDKRKKIRYNFSEVNNNNINFKHINKLD